MPKILEILEYPHPFLKTVAQKVEAIDDEVKEIVANMAATMYAAPGIGLAATQVGVDKSIVVYDVSSPDEEERYLVVLINPEIVVMEGKQLSEGEGCLSFPDFRADVTRAQKVIVEALNLDGKLIRIEADDFHAIVLQHEIDHLFGKTFIEKASPLKRQMYKKKVAKFAKYNEE